MNKSKEQRELKQFYDFLKKFGWDMGQIAFIEALPLDLERKKYIFSVLPKVRCCTISDDEVDALYPYMSEGYFLILKTKVANFLIATPKVPIAKKDSRNVTLELEKLNGIFGDYPKIPITVRDIVHYLNLKEGYVESLALQYYLLTRDKNYKEYFNVDADFTSVGY